MKKKTYHAPSTEISVMNPEGGLCEIIEFGSPADDFSNRRGGYYEEGDEQWGDLWAEEEE